ncbi:MAG: ABC transporter substrate-binding protein, partial [Synergistes sp.]|nr:ABC transporter substrate-binding protein [Synergistes sp.]
MRENIGEVLSEIIEQYGIKILNDPDRLSQFLEDRCGDSAEDAFHLTFALRYLLRREQSLVSRKNRIDESVVKRLCDELGYTEKQARDTVDLINAALEGKLSENKYDGENLVASPGNLKKISGGISNRPRTKLIRKRSTINGVITIAVLSVLCALFFQIGGQRTPVSDNLRIAFFAPMSGPEAAVSHVQLRAAQLAVERINSQRGTKGAYKLSVVGFDLPKDPKSAVETVSRVMKDKNFLVMMLGSDNGAAGDLAKLSDKIEVPLVIVSPTPPGDEDISDGSQPCLYTFSLTNDASTRGKMLSYFATQALHKNNFAVYYDANDNLSEDIRKALRKWSEAFGAKIAAEISYSDESSHLSAMKAVKESGADLLIIPAADDESAAIISAARAAGLDEMVLGEGYNKKIFEEGGSALKGSWWLNEISALDPPIRSVLKDYHSLYNENCPPEYVTAALLAYDGVIWIGYALRNSPGFSGEAIR